MQILFHIEIHVSKQTSYACLLDFKLIVQNIVFMCQSEVPLTISFIEYLKPTPKKDRVSAWKTGR